MATLSLLCPPLVATGEPVALVLQRKAHERSGQRTQRSDVDRQTPGFSLDVKIPPETSRLHAPHSTAFLRSVQQLCL